MGWPRNESTYTVVSHQQRIDLSLRLISASFFFNSENKYSHFCSVVTVKETRLGESGSTFIIRVHYHYPTPWPSLLFLLLVVDFSEVIHFSSPLLLLQLHFGVGEVRYPMALSWKSGVVRELPSPWVSVRVPSIGNDTWAGHILCLLGGIKTHV